MVLGFELAEGSDGFVAVCRPVSDVGPAVVELLVPPVVPWSLAPPPEGEPKQAVASARVSRPMKRVDEERMRVLESSGLMSRNVGPSRTIPAAAHIESYTTEVAVHSPEVPVGALWDGAGPRVAVCGLLSGPPAQ